MEKEFKQYLEAFNQVYKLIDDIYGSYAGSWGITDAELCVFYALSEHNGDYLQTDICRGWHYSLQTIHTAIKNMEKKGLVALVCQPGNRKNKYIHLTKAGEGLVEEIIRPLKNAEKASFSMLTEEERSLLLPLLQKQANALKAEVAKIHRPKDADVGAEPMESALPRPAGQRKTERKDDIT